MTIANLISATVVLIDSSFVLASSFAGISLESFVSFFIETQLETLITEDTDDWFLSFSNDENVTDTGGKVMSKTVLNVSNIEATWVLFDVLEDTDSSNIVTTGCQN